MKMDESCITKPSGLRRKASLNVTFCVKKEKSNNYKKIYAILQKSEADRTPEEKDILENSAAVVKEVNIRLEKRRRLKSRSEEIEDQPNVLEEKCRVLACALLNAQHLVVYSGAGVSTAARIPDYRGSNGIWTRLQQGKDIGCHDLSQAEPTLTHMALFALYRSGKLKHIVSQNCDGLHLRSGIPKIALSEVHGNMYLEVCSLCKVEYWRLFDVTEHTGRYSHETARLCFYCRKPLRDTIVHFGERGALRWPLNWKGACRNADKADMILCIGSSLKVLKRYPWLWCMDKPVKKRPLLFIVNLQWTPKDDQATLKINGKCDQVMRLVMSHMGMTIPEYIRPLDPIFYHATVLHEVEVHTTSQPILQQHKVEQFDDAHEKSLDDDDDDEGKIAFIHDEEGELKLNVVKEEVVITSVHCDEDVKADIDMSVSGSDNLIDNPLEKTFDSVANKSDHENMTESTGVVKNESNVKVEGVVKMESLSNDLWRPFMECHSRNMCSMVEPLNIQSHTGFNHLCNGGSKEQERRKPNEFFQTVPYSKNNKSVPINATIVNNLVTNSAVSSQGMLSNTFNQHNTLLYMFRNTYDSSNSVLLQSAPLDLSSNKSAVCESSGDSLEAETTNQKPTFCQFCCDSYGNKICQFYKQLISVSPSTGPFCYCCDEDSEDDSVTDKDKDKDVTEKDKADKGKGEVNTAVNKVPIINPGWFGKGYRKRARKKR